MNEQLNITPIDSDDSFFVGKSFPTKKESSESVGISILQG